MPGPKLPIRVVILKERKNKHITREGPRPMRHIKNTDQNFYTSKLDDSPINHHKRNNPNPNNKYKINMNSSLSVNKTFRSPVASSISKEYKKKEYNTSFSLSKSKGKLYRPSELEDTNGNQHYRHNSSHLQSQGDKYNYSQQPMGKSPVKSNNRHYETPTSQSSTNMSLYRKKILKAVHQERQKRLQPISAGLKT